MSRLWICLSILVIGLIVIEAKKSHKNLRVDVRDNFDQNLYQSFYTSDDRKISIYNKFLLPSTVYLIRQYLSESGKWEITLNDYNNGSDYKDESPDHVMWKSFLDPQFIQKSQFGQKVLRAVEHFKGNEQGKNYSIYHATAKLVVRSEVPKGSIDAAKDDDDISAILYLTSKWRKNDYGDILFYHDNKEIVCAVHPNMFRMIMFDSSIQHLYKPPAIDDRTPLQTIHLKLTRSKDKLNRAIQHYKTRSQHRVLMRNTKLNDIAPVSLARVIDVQKHITRQFTAPNGKKIYVLDDLYTPQELEGLRRLVEYKQCFYLDSVDAGSDAVSWMAQFSLQDFVDSNLWNIHQQVAKHVGSRDSYFPYDVSCNMIKSNDNTRVHSDCSLAADQWTMVTYLNPNWTAQMGGETAYFESMGEDSNYITEVRPRYGRSVIFQSTILHSARPPSNDFDGIRYTFSVKMAEDEPQARLNRLTEDFQQYSGRRDNGRAIGQIARSLGYTETEETIIAMLTTDASSEEDQKKQTSDDQNEGASDDDQEDQSPDQKNDASAEQKNEEEGKMS